MPVMPMSLLVFVAILALLAISVLLIPLFTLLVRDNPEMFGGKVQSWRTAVSIAVTGVGIIWMLTVLTALFLTVVIGLFG